MWSPVINAASIIVCSLLGLAIGKRIKERYFKSVMTALYVCSAIIGITMAIKSQDALCLVLCLTVGTFLGEWIDLEKRIDGLGEMLRRKMEKDDGKESRFTEGFMTATLLFCVGSVAIMCSIEAGLRNDYSLSIYKTVTDSISSIVFAASLGIGVMFSGFAVLIYQGTITLLASQLQGVLTEPIITEMSAVGGVLLFALGINAVFQTKDFPVKTANMIPAIFLPIVYFAASNWITGLF